MTVGIYILGARMAAVLVLAGAAAVWIAACVMNDSAELSL